MNTEPISHRTDPVHAAIRRMATLLRGCRQSGAHRIASPVSRNGIVVLSLTFTPAAHAYIGPGLGVGAIAVALGGVGFFLFVLSTALWYPFKRLLRRRRAKTTDALRQDDEPRADTGAEDGARH